MLVYYVLYYRLMMHGNSNIKFYPTLLLCTHLQLPVGYVNDPKVLVTIEVHVVVITTNISVNRTA